MKGRNYGYFGNGLSGYAHYRTAFKRTQRKGQTPAAHAPKSRTPPPRRKPIQSKKSRTARLRGVYILLIVGGLVLACVVLVAIQQMLMNL